MHFRYKKITVKELKKDLFKNNIESRRQIMNITIVDYNLGNIRSVSNMLGILKNVKVKVSNNRNEILKSDKLIIGIRKQRRCYESFVFISL